MLRMHSHAPHSSQRDLHFVPLVVSTFGVLQDDFLRLLWLATSSARGAGLAVGEVLEAGQSWSHGQQLFTKL